MFSLIFQSIIFTVSSESSQNPTIMDVDEIHDNGMYELLGAHCQTFCEMATNGIVIAFK